MQKHSGWHINRKVLFLGAVITFISFLLAYLFGFIIAPSFFESWQNKISDGFFKLRYTLNGKGDISPYIIHAVLDDTSYHSFETAGDDNNLYYRILSTIANAGVKAIACDIFFSKRGRYLEDNRQFKRAAGQAKIYVPVILYPENYVIGFDRAGINNDNEALVEKNLWYPKVLGKGNPPAARMIITPIPDVAENACGLGHITCDPDVDGINRRFPLLYKYKDGYFPALVLRMLADVLGVASPDIEVFFGRYIRLPDARCGEFVRKDITIPIDAKGRIIVNFAGSWDDSFIHFPVHNLLKTEMDTGLKLRLYDDFEGSIVLFSDTSTRNKDYGPGIFDRVYPLSGLHLNIANTILTGEFIHKPGIGIHVIISLVVALIFWVLSFTLRPAGYLVSSVCLIFLYMIFAAWVFISVRVLLTMTHDLAGLCVALLLICFYRFVIEDREKRILIDKALTAKKLKNINTELEAANKTLKQVERYREHFVQNITHEFRTPLTLILSPLDTLLENNEIKNKPEILKTLSIIKRNSQKLLYLIEQLLDLSKIKSGKMDLVINRCNIVDLLFSLVEYFLPLAKNRGIRLEFKKNVDTFFVPVDKEKLEKVISNLLSNALKFSKKGDKIIVECIPPVFLESLKIEWPFEKPQEVYGIRVRDTGIGIPEKDLSVIFERYKQGEQRDQNANSGSWSFGSGIGLALVREYIAMHHGIVTVESRPGKGTVFDIYLPATDTAFENDPRCSVETGSESAGFTGRFKSHADLLFSDLMQRSETSSAEINGTSGKRHGTILVIDNDGQMRDYLRLVLSRRYSVYEATDGEEGFRIACDSKPDLVIVDLLMPRTDGIALLKKFRSNPKTEGIPVLLVTARTTEDMTNTDETVLPQDYLVKPFGPLELETRVSNLLEAGLFNKLHIQPHDDKMRESLPVTDTGIVFPGDPVLFVDDEKEMLDAEKTACAQYGITNSILCDDGRRVMSLLAKNSVSCVVIDLAMPHVSGRDLLEKIKLHYPEIPVIVVTGISAIDSAVDCMRNGAFDYLVKPVERERLATVIRHCIERRILTEENNRLRNSLSGYGLMYPDAFSKIITRNDSMLTIFKVIESFADSNQPVLICGESGVGKELIAEAIHLSSKRTGKFIAENIAGLDSTIFSDTLFGHVKGAYTGAVTQRRGLVEEAAGGTLFLDEIGELDTESQVKLLRFLEYREYRHIGSDQTKHSDARIIAATNVSLDEKIEECRFRKDLYYRFSQKITIPPLRERLDDVPVLLDFFLEKSANAYHKAKPKIDPELISIVSSYHYPGNVREFAAMIDRAVNLHSGGGALGTAFFRDYIRQHGNKPLINIEKTTRPSSLITYSGNFPTIDEVEYFFIQQAMKKANGNQRIASKLLGLSTSALNRRLKKGKIM
ncbi:MAG: sigma 54-interacting transcriptional regulator [Spirochaetales bacterium]|nr:sigma 54-interacting transcriptional regulator [Spirochaetales bacterium]